MKPQDIDAPLSTHVEPIEFRAADGVILRGDYWHARCPPVGAVLINAATGVQARYYHRYAEFLTRRGFNVLTYDYRGIGASRPAHLRRCDYKWRDWGEFDCSAALVTLKNLSEGPICLVGHSIGGILPGLANGNDAVRRMLTVGAQYAWWFDYASAYKRRMFLKWHVIMPLLTAIFGYFPGKRLGWLEDLPSGVANEWSFRGARIERSYPSHRRHGVLEQFRSMSADILAIATTDDEYATPTAVRRGLSYFHNSMRTFIALPPADLSAERIGHFDLFHSRHENQFWHQSANWLATGVIPWPNRTIYKAEAGHVTPPMSPWRASSEEYALRVSLEKLEGLDEHLLADVGLTRDVLEQQALLHRIKPRTSQNSVSKRTRAHPFDSPW